MDFKNMKIPLSPNRFITCRFENDQYMIYVGEYGPSGDYLSERHLSFTLTQWATLVMLSKCIDSTISDITNGLRAETLFRHIGSNKHVSVSYKYGVDLRQFYFLYKINDIRPNRKGIALTFKQWHELKLALKLLPKYIPSIEDTSACILRDDHANQIGYWSCRNCNPNSYSLV